MELARHCRLPKNQVLAVAVAGGSVTVRKAMTALRQVGQVEHSLEPGKREEALASLTQMAQSGYDRNVVAVGRSLMALVGADRSLERHENMLAALSCLRLSPLDKGMLRVSGQLDPEAGAVLTATLDPFSAPNPCEANGGRDPRPPDRRRAEAVRGTGTTLAGAVLAPETVRRLACDASIIPMFLGSMSQPLDVGRTNPPQAGGAPSLVTPDLLAALWFRDKACTPGCGRPPRRAKRVK